MIYQTVFFVSLCCYSLLVRRDNPLMPNNHSSFSSCAEDIRTQPNDILTILISNRKGKEVLILILMNTPIYIYLLFMLFIS